MKKLIITILLGVSVLAGCTQVPPPPSNDQCIENPDAPMCPWYPGYNPRPTCVIDIDCPITTTTVPEVVCLSVDDCPPVPTTEGA